MIDIGKLWDCFVTLTSGKKSIAVSSAGENLDVIVGDQTTPPVDFYFLQGKGTPSTIAVQTVINETSVTVVSDAGFTVGDYIGIFCPDENRFYFATLLAKPGSNVLNLDTPLDFAFGIGDNVIGATRELNVSGTIGTPQIFFISGAGPASTVEIDITRIIFQMITTDAPTYEKFGDLAALTNGLVLRRNNGITNNIFNAKSNGDLANLMYDLTFLDPLNPSGVNGIAGRMTFAGQAKHGVAIRLGSGDFLELYIQDDLEGLLSFRIMAQGHVVD